MSIALKNESGDFILFDIITNYSKSYPSQVTQHPVDGSGTVSDHVIKNNMKVEVKGFITGADFNTGKPALGSEDRAELSVGSVVLPETKATEVVINYDGSPYNLLPDVVGQFFNDPSAVVSGINEGRYDFYNERNLANVVRSFYENKDKLTLYEFDGGELLSDATIENVYLTSFRPSETVKNGDALSFDISLEKVVISDLITEEIPEQTREDFNTKSSDSVSKGGVSTNQVDGPESGDVPTSVIGGL